VHRTLVLILLVVVGAGCSSSGKTSTSTTAPTTTSTAITATSTTEGTGAIPAEYFAVSPDNRIVAVSVTTGRVTRELEPATVAGTPYDLTLSADRRTLFFARGGHLQMLPAAGGSAVPIGTLTNGQSAMGPAPSADGKHLAWVRNTDVPIGMERSDIMLSNLVTGTQQVVPGGAQPQDLSLNASSTQIAMQDNGGFPIVITISATGTRLSSRDLKPSDPACVFRKPHFVPNSDRLAVVETCGGSPTTPSVDTFVVLGPDGQQTNLATVPSPEGVAAFAFDRSGQVILFITSDFKPTATTDLWMLRDGHQLRVPHPFPVGVQSEVIAW
jgi:hypothetical protein